MFSRLMPSEVAGPGRWSCKFTQQHTSPTGERRAPKIAQTAIGEKGAQVVVTKDRFLTTKWSYLNIMCAPITHADTAGCSSIYLDSHLKSLSFAFSNSYCGWNVLYHRAVHSTCLLITMDMWCWEARHPYDPSNKEQHRSMYWCKTWKALMMWIMC